MRKKSSTLKLIIKNLHVSIENKEIIHGIDLTIKPGELHVVMGPNGSGKSTLTYALMGHPSYLITQGQIQLNNISFINLKPHERAQKGLMLAFQNPIAVPGVTLSSFMRTAFTQIHGKDALTMVEFHNLINQEAKRLNLDASFLRRAINDGFSGGEKKKAEMLQLLVLKPKFAIFDEIDTGLDVDALKTVAASITLLKKSKSGILLITHYQRILNYVQPDYVHVMIEGKFVANGGPELARQIEAKGYAAIRRT